MRSTYDFTRASEHAFFLWKTIRPERLTVFRSKRLLHGLLNQAISTQSTLVRNCKLVEQQSSAADGRGRSKQEGLIASAEVYHVHHSALNLTFPDIEGVLIGDLVASRCSTPSCFIGYFVRTPRPLPTNTRRYDGPCLVSDIEHLL